MKTILIVILIVISYSPKVIPPPLVEIGDTTETVLHRYGLPNEYERVLISGLYCYEWTYISPPLMVRFRLDKVIYIE